MVNRPETIIHHRPFTKKNPRPEAWDFIDKGFNNQASSPESPLRVPVLSEREPPPPISSAPVISPPIVSGDVTLSGV
jgi:hypothetical protein